jgi:hypothetical protein
MLPTARGSNLAMVDIPSQPQDIKTEAIVAALREPVPRPPNGFTNKDRTLIAMREAAAAKIEGTATPRQLRFLARRERQAIRESVWRYVRRQQETQVDRWALLPLLRSALTEFLLYAAMADKTGSRVFIRGMGSLDGDQCRQVAKAVRELIAFAPHPTTATDDLETLIELDRRGQIRREKPEATTGPPPRPKTPNGPRLAPRAADLANSSPLTHRATDGGEFKSLSKNFQRGFSANVFARPEGDGR